jgi:hypothetical protein
LQKKYIIAPVIRPTIFNKKTLNSMINPMVITFVVLALAAFFFVWGKIRSDVACAM